MAKRRSLIDLELQQVYDDVPEMDCKGLCRDWCSGKVPASSREHQRVSAVGQPLSREDKGACTNLLDSGACGVYEARPLICRLWGAVDNMSCPHGCVPRGGRLSREDGAALVERAVAVAGEAL